jgi:hypothetical protein
MIGPDHHIKTGPHRSKTSTADRRISGYEGFFIAQPGPEFNGNREVSHIPLRGTELLKEGDLECNNFGESNKVMNVPFISDLSNCI